MKTILLLFAATGTMWAFFQSVLQERDKQFAPLLELRLPLP